jgi:hypothetical protein
MGKELKMIPAWSDRVKYLFKKPGWLPESLGGYRSAPAVDVNTYKKYSPSYPVRLNYYVLFQYLICLAVTAVFLFKQKEFSIGEKALAATLISIWVVNCGVLFEQKAWVRMAEWLRIVLFVSIAVAITYFSQLSVYGYVVGLLYGIVSAGWFYSLSHRNEKVVVS